MSVELRDVRRCNQRGCLNASVYVYTWPGHELVGSCQQCAERAASVALFMGFHLHLVPLIPTVNA